MECTHEDDPGRQQLRPANHKDAPGEVALDHSGCDGTHDRHAEPGVVEGDQCGMIAVVVDEVLECDVRDESGLDPFPDEQAVYCSKAQQSSGGER